MAGPEDPFGTTSVRERVLAAWTASPARFREDANAEEDHALGGYRDRLVVELAQNAADAAARAGVTGALLLTLRDDVLTASNTGGPLDPAGVEALSTLRASAKRDDDPEPPDRRRGVVVALGRGPERGQRLDPSSIQRAAGVGGGEDVAPQGQQQCARDPGPGRRVGGYRDRLVVELAQNAAEGVVLLGVGVLPEAGRRGGPGGEDALAQGRGAEGVVRSGHSSPAPPSRRLSRGRAR